MLEGGVQHPSPVQHRKVRSMHEVRARIDTRARVQARTLTFLFPGADFRYSLLCGLRLRLQMLTGGRRA